MSIVSAFRASRGGVTPPAGPANDQPNGTHLAYAQFMANVAEINIGNDYDVVNCVWKPPAGLVEISALIWWNANFAPISATQPNAACIKAYKWNPNGGTKELKAAPGYTGAGYPGTAGAALPAFLDECVDGDAYSLWLYGTSKNATNDLVIDGHHAHSWWCGKAYGA